MANGPLTNLFFRNCILFYVINVFLFDYQYHFQIQGVAMGTPCAQLYANLYLGHWEQLLFSDDSSSIYLCHFLMWHRYIDDVFVIWEETIKLFQEFFHKMSTNDFNLRITISSSVLDLLCPQGRKRVYVRK